MPETLCDAQRLTLLQQHDSLRPWTSVDDLRTCVGCGRIFSGRHIRIHQRANRYAFRCPTRHCRRSLSHFAQAGNPLLDDTVFTDWLRTIDLHEDETGDGFS